MLVAVVETAVVIAPAPPVSRELAVGPAEGQESLAFAAGFNRLRRAHPCFGSRPQPANLSVVLAVSATGSQTPGQRSIGFRLTMIQITGKDRDAIWRLLGVRPSGTACPHPFEDVSGRGRPDGAYLIVARDDKGRHAEADLLRALSAGADLLVCQIHEGCMWSQAGGWRDGEQVWSIEHVSEHGLHHLNVVGAPPPQMAGIREAREARQAAERPGPFGVDHIFDIAPTLYAALTGYRYDRIDPAAVLEVLIPA